MRRIKESVDYSISSLSNKRPEDITQRIFTDWNMFKEALSSIAPPVDIDMTERPGEGYDGETVMTFIYDGSISYKINSEFTGVLKSIKLEKPLYLKYFYVTVQIDAVNRKGDKRIYDIVLNPYMSELDIYWNKKGLNGTKEMNWRHGLIDKNLIELLSFIAGFFNRETSITPENLIRESIDYSVPGIKSKAMTDFDQIKIEDAIERLSEIGGDNVISQEVLKQEKTNLPAVFFMQKSFPNQQWPIKIGTGTAYLEVISYFQVAYVYEELLSINFNTKEIKYWPQEEKAYGIAYSYYKDDIIKDKIQYRDLSNLDCPEELKKIIYDIIHMMNPSSEITYSVTESVNYSISNLESKAESEFDEFKIEEAKDRMSIVLDNDCDIKEELIQDSVNILQAMTLTYKADETDNQHIVKVNDKDVYISKLIYMQFPYTGKELFGLYFDTSQLYSSDIMSWWEYGILYKYNQDNLSDDTVNDVKDIAELDCPEELKKYIYDAIRIMNPETEIKYSLKESIDYSVSNLSSGKAESYFDEFKIEEAYERLATLVENVDSISKCELRNPLKRKIPACFFMEYEDIDSIIKLRNGDAYITKLSYCQDSLSFSETFEIKIDVLNTSLSYNTIIVTYFYHSNDKVNYSEDNKVFIITDISQMNCPEEIKRYVYNAIRTMDPETELKYSVKESIDYSISNLFSGKRENDFDDFKFEEANEHLIELLGDDAKIVKDEIKNTKGEPASLTLYYQIDSKDLNDRLIKVGDKNVYVSKLYYIQYAYNYFEMLTIWFDVYELSGDTKPYQIFYQYESDVVIDNVGARPSYKNISEMECPDELKRYIYDAIRIMNPDTKIKYMISESVDYSVSNLAPAKVVNDFDDFKIEEANERLSELSKDGDIIDEDIVEDNEGNPVSFILNCITSVYKLDNHLIKLGDYNVYVTKLSYSQLAYYYTERFEIWFNTNHLPAGIVRALLYKVFYVYQTDSVSDNINNKEFKDIAELDCPEPMKSYIYRIIRIMNPYTEIKYTVNESIDYSVSNLPSKATEPFNEIKVENARMNLEDILPYWPNQRISEDIGREENKEDKIQYIELKKSYSWFTDEEQYETLSKTVPHKRFESEEGYYNLCSITYVQGAYTYEESLRIVFSGPQNKMIYFFYFYEQDKLVYMNREYKLTAVDFKKSADIYPVDMLKFLYNVVHIMNSESEIVFNINESIDYSVSSKHITNRLSDNYFNYERFEDVKDELNDYFEKFDTPAEYDENYSSEDDYAAVWFIIQDPITRDEFEESNVVYYNSNKLNECIALCSAHYSVNRYTEDEFLYFKLTTFSFKSEGTASWEIDYDFKNDEVDILDEESLKNSYDKKGESLWNVLVDVISIVNPETKMKRIVTESIDYSISNMKITNVDKYNMERLDDVYDDFRILFKDGDHIIRRDAGEFYRIEAVPDINNYRDFNFKTESSNFALTELIYYMERYTFEETIEFNFSGKYGMIQIYCNLTNGTFGTKHIKDVRRLEDAQIVIKPVKKFIWRVIDVLGCLENFDYQP